MGQTTTDHNYVYIVLLGKTKNVEIAVGLTNGTKGEVNQIIGASKDNPDCVIVNFGKGVTLPQLTGLQQNCVYLFFLGQIHFRTKVNQRNKELNNQANVFHESNFH